MYTYVNVAPVGPADHIVLFVGVSGLIARESFSES